VDTSSSPVEPPLIGVIGSARIEVSDERWEEAYSLGTALAEQGWRVMTGGYGGLMEAAARGAHDGGAAVVGLPMRAWSELTPNRWSGELRWAADYSERLRELLTCDAIIALAGGIGTLSEATVTWSALQTEPDAAQLVLLGAHWRRLLAVMSDELVIGAQDLALIHQTDNLSAAIAVLRRLVGADRPDRASHPRG
jgi:uncharacterized protein (TIGR00730 family)